MMTSKARLAHLALAALCAPLAPDGSAAKVQGAADLTNGRRVSRSTRDREKPHHMLVHCWPSNPSAVLARTRSSGLEPVKSAAFVSGSLRSPE